MWNQRGSWECCANPLSFLDFKLDNYFCISSLLSCRLGFSSPTGAMGSWAYHVWNAFFLLKQSPNHNAVPSKCGVNCCHPAYRDTPIAHLWKMQDLFPARIGWQWPSVSGNMWVFSSCGSATCCGYSSCGCGCADHLSIPVVAFPTLPSSPLLSSQQQEKLKS